MKFLQCSCSNLPSIEVAEEKINSVWRHRAALFAVAGQQKMMPLIYQLHTSAVIYRRDLARCAAAPLNCTHLVCPGVVVWCSSRVCSDGVI